jgi:sulfite reductase alpha subunit-like flavoprotein
MSMGENRSGMLSNRNTLFSKKGNEKSYIGHTVRKEGEKK